MDHLGSMKILSQDLLLCPDLLWLGPESNGPVQIHLKRDMNLDKASYHIPPQPCTAVSLPREGVGDVFQWSKLVAPLKHANVGRRAFKMVLFRLYLYHISVFIFNDDWLCCIVIGFNWFYLDALLAALG